MNLKQTAAPSVEPVTTTNQKDWMRVDSSDEDTLIGSLAAAARSYFEMSTNRQLITATWQYKITNFPADEIVLPISPVQSVTSITYVDNADATQTWASANYVVDTSNLPCRIRRAANKDYPSDSRGEPYDIIITFVAGYGDASSDVPDGALTAIKLLAANWYENRESNQPITLTPVPVALDALMLQYWDGTVI
jgi:uncharacterized phiE125 gp8 family phage protein